MEMQPHEKAAMFFKEWVTRMTSEAGMAKKREKQVIDFSDLGAQMFSISSHDPNKLSIVNQLAIKIAEQHGCSADIDPGRYGVSVKFVPKKCD